MSLGRGAGTQPKRTLEVATSSGSSGASEDEYECVVCADVLLDPVVAPLCGHDFCSQCYSRWVTQCHAAQQPAACPLCRCGPLPSTLAVCLRLKTAVERARPRAVQRRRCEQASSESQSTPDPSQAHLNNTPAAMFLSYPTSSSSFSLLDPFLMHAHNTAAADPTAAATGWPIASHAMQSAMAAAMTAATAAAMQWPGMAGPATMQAMQQQSWAMMAAATQLPGPNPAAITATAALAPATQLDVCCTAGTCVSTGTATPAALAASQPAAAAATVQEAWQSDADGADRLAVARGIIRVLLSRGLHAALGEKLPEAVRLLELMLYRTAPSKQAYLAQHDMETRIAAAVRQRLGAAKSRRERLTPSGTSAAGAVVPLPAPAAGLASV